jgi:two-component system response regulator AtoC
MTARAHFRDLVSASDALSETRWRSDRSSRAAMPPTRWDFVDDSSLARRHRRFRNMLAHGRSFPRPRPHTFPRERGLDLVAASIKTSRTWRSPLWVLLTAVAVHEEHHLETLEKSSARRHHSSRAAYTSQPLPINGCGFARAPGGITVVGTFTATRHRRPSGCSPSRMSHVLDSAREARPVILLVADDASVREALSLVLGDVNELLDAAGSEQAFAILRSRHIDLVLLDTRLRDEMDGITILERIRRLDDEVRVILLTAVVDEKTAGGAIQLGALEYLTKPFEDEIVRGIVSRALQHRALGREVTFLRAELASRVDHTLIGEAPAMKQLRDVIARVASLPSTVLITGESGTGKELVAQAIHHRSARRAGPFVAAHAGTLSDTMIESELFGHERGAFTGAFQRKLGRFELADHGTLLLDKIDTLKPELQVKLLRVLQEREMERVGGTQRIKIDVRIIATTSVDLRAAVATRQFREDLYYRLNVIAVQVPPLCERLSDVGLLAEHFIARFNRNWAKQIAGITAEAVMAAQAYRWPGNVRELQNVIERCVALAEGPLIDVRDLPLELFASPASDSDGAPEHWFLREACRRFERQFVLRVLEACHGNQQEAARRLGVHRNTLVSRLSKWGLTRANRTDGGGR